LDEFFEHFQGLREGQWLLKRQGAGRMKPSTFGKRNGGHRRRGGAILGMARGEMGEGGSQITKSQKGDLSPLTDESLLIIVIDEKWRMNAFDGKGKGLDLFFVKD